mgnify:FL=1
MSDAEGPRGINRRLSFEITESLRQRFLAKVCQRGPDECWYWSGAQRNGYGAIKHHGKVIGAHVVAVVLDGRTIPPGMLVTHTCDIKTCVNPRHLELGTAADNLREALDRNINKPITGEQHANAKLSDEKVVLIRSLRIVRGIGATLIARALGVNIETVKSCLSGDTWRHVVQPDMATMKRLCESVVIQRNRPT